MCKDQIIEKKFIFSFILTTKFQILSLVLSTKTTKESFYRKHKTSKSHKVLPECHIQILMNTFFDKVPEDIVLLKILSCISTLMTIFIYSGQHNTLLWKKHFCQHLFRENKPPTFMFTLLFNFNVVLTCHRSQPAESVLQMDATEEPAPCHEKMIKQWQSFQSSNPTTALSGLQNHLPPHDYNTC